MLQTHETKHITGAPFAYRAVGPHRQNERGALQSGRGAHWFDWFSGSGVKKVEKKKIQRSLVSGIIHQVSRVTHLVPSLNQVLPYKK